MRDGGCPTRGRRGLALEGGPLRPAASREPTGESRKGGGGGCQEGGGGNPQKAERASAAGKKSPARSGAGTAPLTGTALRAPPRRAGGAGGSRAARAGRCAGRAPTSGRRAHIDAGARPRSPRSRRKQDGGAVGAGSAAPGLCVLDVGEAEGRGRGQSGMHRAGRPSPHGTAGRCRGAAPRRAAGGRRGGGAAAGPPTWLADSGGGGAAAAAPSPRGRSRAAHRRPSPRLCLRTADGGAPALCRSPAPGGHKGGRSPGREAGGLRGLGRARGRRADRGAGGLGREKCVRARRGLGARPPLFRAMIPHACFARVAKPRRRGTMWPRDEKENHFAERVPLEQRCRRGQARSPPDDRQEQQPHHAWVGRAAVCARIAAFVGVKSPP